MTSRTTSLVTSRIVRSPVISSPDAVFSTFLETKVMVGNLATSKKSALFRCSSRLATRVSMDAASMLTVIFAVAGSSPTVCMLALNELN